MKARAQLERLFGGPAPVEAPPKPDVKPDTRPVERPGRPAPTPGRPSPMRRKDIKPGHEPAPKSRLNRVNAEALEFLKANGLEEFAP
jgi:hypothetical protein